MVEIARAFTVTDEPLASSSSTSRPPRSTPTPPANCSPSCAARSPAGQLRPHLAPPRRGAARPATASSSCATARSSPPTASRNLSRAKLVAAMGGVESEARRPRSGAGARRAADPRARPPRAAARTGANSSPTKARSSASPASPATARPSCCSPPSTPPRARGRARRVDRAGRARRRRPQSDGIFPLWSIAENIGVRSLKRLRAGLLISRRPRAELAECLARADRHPHARRRQQHPVAVGRQPAEGAVRPRARLRRARSC